MGASQGLLSAGYGVMGLSSLASGISNASAYRAQGQYQKAQADANAAYLEQMAIDAKRRGDVEAGKARVKTAQTVGAQRVAYAAQGLNIDSGTPADIQAETRAIGAHDEMTIRNNAWRESFGYRAQAINQSTAGTVADISGRMQANTSLLTGGMQALGYGLQAGAYFPRSVPKISHNDLKWDF